MSVISTPLPSLADTQALAVRVAEALRMGDTVFLRGEVGAGKTTFAQYLIRALAGAGIEVTSPTFTLVQDYPVRLSDGTAGTLLHYDLYRIEDVSAFAELGLDEGDAVRVIEWPERLPGSFAPPSWISIHFLLEQGSRHARCSAGGSAQERLAA